MEEAKRPVLFSSYENGEEAAGLDDPRMILKNLRVLGRVAEETRSDIRKLVNVTKASAMQAAVCISMVLRPPKRVAVFGSGPLGLAVVDSLLALNWPCDLIELVALDEPVATPYRGVAVCTGKYVGLAKRCHALALAIRPVAAEAVAKTLGPALRTGEKFIVSCITGLLTSKQRASFNTAFFVRTRVDPTVELRGSALDALLEHSLRQLSLDDANHMLNTCRDYCQYFELDPVPPPVSNLDDFLAVATALSSGVARVNNSHSSSSQPQANLDDQLQAQAPLPAPASAPLPSPLSSIIAEAPVFLVAPVDHEETTPPAGGPAAAETTSHDTAAAAAAEEKKEEQEEEERATAARSAAVPSPTSTS